MHKKRGYDMYTSNEVAKKIRLVAKIKKVTIKEMLSEIGLGVNTLSNMKASMPKADNLAKMADYLGCSVDYLLGRECYSNVDGNGNVIQQGRIQNSPVTVSNVAEIKLTEQEKEILRIFSQLSAKEKAKLFLEICEYDKK